MPPKSADTRPLQGHTTYPQMDPLPPQGSTFLDRVYDVAQRWIQREWECIETIKRGINARSPDSLLLTAIRDTRLTTTTLAKHLDNISVSSLKRELAKHKAPPPGQLIRETRIRFAMHLLLHTRLKIHHIAARAGYTDPEHFAALFKKQTKLSPHVYRRNGERKQSKPLKRPSTP